MTRERYLVGLIEAGIGSSMSPDLHEREADRQGDFRELTRDEPDA